MCRDAAKHIAKGPGVGRRLVGEPTASCWRRTLRRERFWATFLYDRSGIEFTMLLRQVPRRAYPPSGIRRWLVLLVMQHHG